MDNASQPPQPQKSASQRIPGIPALLLFLFAVGVPSATALAFAHTMSQNPWQWVLIGLFYELCVGIVGFLGKVWQKLEDSFVEHTAAWLSTGVLLVFSRSWRRYRRYLVYEHQVFDMKGLSTLPDRDLELEQVFVQLNVDPTPVHQASANPIAVPEVLRKGSYDIWRYLAEKQLRSQHLVIVGTPGSGKTTLLKHLALSLARNKKRGVPRFPILLYLRDHAATIQDKYDRTEDIFAYSLAEAVNKHIQRKWQQLLPLAWIEGKLTNGKCLVLLDGLDEVADVKQRKLVAAWVQRQMIAYGQNRFVLTSRPYGYRDNPLEGVMVLETRPFTTNQIEHFVRNWYLANERKSWQKEDPGVHMRAREGAQDLLRRLYHTPALLAFAVNPLLLTMIATVHRYRGSLPGSRVALYGEICEVFLGKRKEKVGITQEFSPAHMQQVLMPLAYHLMQQGTLEITQEEAYQIIAPYLLRISTHLQPDEFLQVVQNTSSLVLERNPGIYSFAHKTFQEYLTAVYLKEQQLEQSLIAQVDNDWWHETIRLYCAQADATGIVQTALSSIPLSAKVLSLALDCAKEKLTIDPSVKKRLDVLLEQGKEDPDPERRQVIAEALLRRRLEQMIHVHDEIFIDTSFVTCIEYQLFLDEFYTRGKQYQPDHWSTTVFPQGEGHTPVLGIQPEDALAFCQWLTERDAGTWRYRLPTKSEQQQLEIQSHEVCALERGTGYWIENGRNFAWIGDKVPPPLEWNGTSFSKFAFNLANDRDRTINFANANVSALNLARDLNLNRDLNLARDLNLNRDLDIALNFALDIALNRALDLDLHLNRALNRALVHALVHALTSANASAPVLDRALNRAITRARTRVSDLKLASDLVRDLASARERARDLASDLAIALALALDFNTDVEITSALVFLCALNRVLTILAKPSARRWWQWRLNNQSTDQDTVSRAAIHCVLLLYIDLLIIKQRKEGKLPAWEGILLVKEKMQKEELG